MSDSSRRVAIVGLGLMGGSLARDLAARSVTVFGYDLRPGVAEEAVERGVIDRSLGPDMAGLEEVGLIVLATPVNAATDALPLIARVSAPDAVITDVGSTKRDILAAAARAGLGGRFVGSHPLAGNQRSGWDAARSDLYTGATVFVCSATESSPEAVARVLDLWRAVGATPRAMDAAEHDRMMSTVSHLPQVVSSALAILLQDAGYAAADLGPGGRDMTRLAESSAEMWAAIAGSNADNLLESVSALEEVLGDVRGLLERGDVEGLRAFFESGRRLRQ